MAKTATKTERTIGEDLASYLAGLRGLKARKREVTREISDQIKTIEGVIEALSGEILALPGAHHGRLFDGADDDA